MVAQKAALGIVARLKQLASPVSIHTSESSQGQEDYLSMAVPTIARLFDMVELTKMLLAYELLGALVALNLRTERAGEGVVAIQEFFADKIAPLKRDRSPGPDVEVILGWLDSAEFNTLVDGIL